MAMPVLRAAASSLILILRVGLTLSVSVLLPVVAQANDEIAGHASVIDGDTVEIRSQRIRLWGLDAPEGKQRCVKDAKLWRAHVDSANALDGYLANRPITCTQRGIDRYKRIVATCIVDSADIGEWMVRMGWAYDFTRYSKGYYAAAQAEATAHRRGLWQGECEMPWDWRRNR